MKTLPHYLFDKILEFNHPFDMIKCKLLNKEYKKNVENLFKNPNSFIQQKYSQTLRIDRYYTWFNMIRYQNLELVQINVITYKTFFKINKLKRNEFYIIFSALRDMYDSSKDFNIGIIFYEFFINNLNIFKVNIYYLTELERYKQETYFYYLIDIYITSKKGVYLKYLSDIFDDLFLYLFSLEDKDTFILHRIIYNYIHAFYVRKPENSELYRLLLNKIDEYELDIYGENNMDEDFYDAYNFIFSDY